MRGGVVAILIAAALLPLSAVLLARGAIGLLAQEPASERGWRWARGPPAGVARTEVAAAVAAGGVYVIGGLRPPRRTTAIVERFDLRGRDWSRVRPLPEPRNHAAAVGYRGRVYVAGGYASADGLTEPSRRLFRFSPRSGRWRRLADLPTPRGALALAAAGGRLYALGGSDGRRALPTVEIYDVARDRWSAGPDMGTAREHLGAVGVGRAVYVVGGRNAGGNLALFERLSPGGGRWRRLPDLDKARGGNGVAAARAPARIFAVGGEEPDGTIAQVELFDPRRPRRGWRRLPDMPTPRHGLGVALDDRSDRLYALAGGPQPGFAFSRRLEVLVPRR